MSGSIMSLFSQSILQISQWFTLLLNKSGFTSPFLAAFFLFALGRFFLAPLVGSSDSVNRRSKDE